MCDAFSLFFFSSRRRHTRSKRDWSSDVCSSDLLWHRRLADGGMKNLHKLLKGEHILGLTNVHFEKDRICSACQAGKQVGAHHPHKNIMTTGGPLELLHMDLFGPIAYIRIGGSKYCLVIVDDYSRFTWVFFLQEKSQTQETLKGFLRRDRKSTRLNSSHVSISYAVFCLKKKKNKNDIRTKLDSQIDLLSNHKLKTSRVKFIQHSAKKIRNILKPEIIADHNKKHNSSSIR